MSTFGKLMDPLADKLLVTAALVSLVSLDRVSAWVAMVIIAREFAVTGLRQLAMEHGEVIPASIWGKIKTVSQMVAIPMLLYYDPLGAFDPQYWGTWLIYIAAVLTLVSMVWYLKLSLPLAWKR